MVFDIFIDVPIVVGGYFLMLHCRKQLTARLGRIKLPSLAVCMLLSFPLISVLIADRQLSAKNPEISAVSPTAVPVHDGLLP